MIALQHDHTTMHGLDTTTATTMSCRGVFGDVLEAQGQLFAWQAQSKPKQRQQHLFTVKVH